MRWLSPVLALLLPVLGAVSVHAQPDFGFMPDGGKETLRTLVDGGKIPAEELTAKRDEDAWRNLVATADPSLGTAAVETLASYLALNLPAPDGATAVDKLPPDGKELAIANCQFCHSFFTGYLAHDRDVEGWRAIFKSPFHTELPMSAVERETFARYSAIHMPIAYEKVPVELRF